jgi:hypothetical protein
MKQTYLAALVALSVVACADQGPTSPPLAPDEARLSRAPAAFTFTTIEVPGARATVPQGINARGDVVGWYFDADGKNRGFLLRGGEYTTIDYPGAEFTDLRGIGPNGEIVGTYGMPGEPGVAFHSFLLTRQGEFVPIEYPGHLYSIAQRILPDGTILGCRHDNDFMASMRGIVISKDGTSETDAFASMHNGATPDLRRIVGLYTNMAEGRTEGYVIDDGVFKPFVVPGSSMTAAWDVNPAGDVVGFYRDAAGFHGFLRTGDRYTSIDVPGAAATRAIGINAGGDVVGIYVAGGKVYGFLANTTRRPDR